ncbi:MAG: endonuclease MutS2 [Armatimonadota bacterium]|nr:MAG: endonuclease MutS2 [Armatimonadota bacterium]
MNTNALRLLEYGRVLEQLAERCSTGMGMRRALDLAPSADFQEIERWQQETAEGRKLLESFGGMPLGGARDLMPHLEKALLAGSLNGRELLDVHDTAAAAERLRAFFKKQTSACPLLAGLADGLEGVPDLRKAIADAIDDAGEVRDSASPELGKLRRDIRTVTGRIQEKLNSLISSSSLRDALQDPVIVTRQGRWCLPVRSDHRSAVPGIVHDASASGATLFIEPQAVVDLANRLRELEAAEREEVERILRQLTTKVAVRAEELRRTCVTLGHLDLVNAKALLAESQRAVQPELRRSPMLKFTAARHPLLKGEVVPIDVRLGVDFRGLLITGPNTGGKTVTLKTVGLLVLMTQSGLQIPAAHGSECGVFSDVFADIGDEQSIEQSLSTFSGHIRNIVSTLRDIRPGGLALFDEIGAGTDPAEGAALACAVLEHLAARGICIVATTHYGELKRFAFTHPQFENASVEFDRETLKPTYRLLIGVPGASHALHIAARLGMPKEVIRSAERALEGQAQETDNLIRQVEALRAQAMEQERLAEQARKEAEQLRAIYEQNLERLNEARRQVRDEVQSEARRVIDDLQRQLEQVLRELRTQKRHSQHTEGLSNKAKKLIRRMETAAERAAPAPTPEAPPAQQQDRLRKGERVRMTGVGAVGVMLEDATDTEALVAFGNVEARVSPHRLERVEPGEASGPGPADLRTGRLQLQKASSVSPEIMLRGQRVEEALEALDRYLDDACLAGLERVRVIHGKGTGAMRRAVWEFMRRHPAVASMELADAHEGGEGATIVRLK